MRKFLIQHIYVYESISIQIYIYTNMFPSLSLHISSLPIPLQSCILTSRPRCIRLCRVLGTTAIRQVAHAAHTQEPSPPKTRHAKGVVFGGDAETESQHLMICIYMDVSENSGTPKSSTLIGFSIINHPFWVSPFLETPIYLVKV